MRAATYTIFSVLVRKAPHWLICALLVGPIPTMAIYSALCTVTFVESYDAKWVLDVLSEVLPK